MVQLIKNENDQWVVRCDYSADLIEASIEYVLGTNPSIYPSIYPNQGEVAWHI